MEMAAPFQWSLAALETLMAEDQMDQHAAVLRAFSVVELWRLRRVCRAFRRWGTAALVALPRIVAVGGLYPSRSGSEYLVVTASVEVLNLSTMLWSNVLPALPEARYGHSTCAFDDGRVVVAGGMLDVDVDDGETATALQWLPGATEWTALPDLPERRTMPAAVALRDGRAMFIGGEADGGTGRGKPTASVIVLGADGSGWSRLQPLGTPRWLPAATALPCGKVLVAGGRKERPIVGGHQLATAQLWDPATGAWSDLPPMAQARDGPAVAVLPCGKVLRAGGYDGDPYGGGVSLRTAELWDPATGAWSDLPPMAQTRGFGPGCCVLPSGRVAVVGGGAIGYPEGGAGHRADGEAFDPDTRTWQPLPPMAHGRERHGMVAVAGGLVVVGGHGHADDDPNELFDEASGRWFELPHPMVWPRASCCAVSLPAAALAPPAAEAAAEAGP